MLCARHCAQLREVLVKGHSPCSQRTSTPAGAPRPDAGWRDGRNAVQDSLDREGLSQAAGLGELGVPGRSRSKAQRTGLPSACLWLGLQSEVGSPEASRAEPHGRKVSGVCRAFG